MCKPSRRRRRFTTWLKSRLLAIVGVLTVLIVLINTLTDVAKALQQFANTVGL